MKLINEKIKEVFNSKASFSHFLEIDKRDLASKLKTVSNRISWLNAFLEPLGLEIVIREVGE